MKRLRGSQQGFTLVELLVALTIFAIGLLSVAGMQITAMRTNSRANSLTAATAVAEGVLEEILARTIDDPIYASSSAGNDYDFDPDTAGDQPSMTVQGAGTYTATYDIERDYNDVPNVARVVVTVEGANRRITLVGFKRTV
jgi:type IV pilus assembly protein PilV